MAWAEELYLPGAPGVLFLPGGQTLAKSSTPGFMDMPMTAMGTAVSIFGSVTSGRAVQANIPRWRTWTKTNAAILACVNLRKTQVANAQWELLPKNPKKRFSKRAADMVTELLLAPNKGGKDNSFGQLWEQIADDIIVTSIGCVLKIFNPFDELIGLQAIDSGRVTILEDWEEDSDGPRYFVRDLRDPTKGKYLRNDQMITITMNGTTYQETGVAPLMVLENVLKAWDDMFESVHALQKHRAPAGLLNLMGMDNDGVKRIQNLFQMELQGNSTIGFFNYDVSKIDYIPLGSINLQEQGVEWFQDFLVRQICMAFQVSPVNIAWNKETTRATAAEERGVTLDQGVVPLMQLLAGYINREVLPLFDENLQFGWTELLDKPHPEDAAVLRARAGDLLWVSLNELRISDGLDPVHTGNPDIDVWYDLPLIPIGEQMVAPVPFAIEMLSAQRAQTDAQTSLTQNQASLAGHQATAAKQNNQFVKEDRQTAKESQNATSQTDNAQSADKSGEGNNGPAKPQKSFSESFSSPVAKSAMAAAREYSERLAQKRLREQKPWLFDEDEEDDVA